MTLTRVPVFAVALLACGFASAQTEQAAPHSNPVVNKCTAADGSVVFSDAPCLDKQKAQKVDTSAALRTGSGGNSAELAAGVTDTDCRRSARQSANGDIDKKIEESNRHIAEYQQRQNYLASQKAYVSDGSGNLVDDPAARKAIAELDGQIAKERTFQQQTQVTAAAKYEIAAKACEVAAAKNAQSQQDKK